MQETIILAEARPARYDPDTTQLELWNSYDLDARRELADILNRSDTGEIERLETVSGWGHFTHLIRHSDFDFGGWYLVTLADPALDARMEIRLPSAMKDWILANGGAQTVRRLVREAMLSSQPAE